MTPLVSMARAEADKSGKIGPAVTHRLCDEIERLRTALDAISQDEFGEPYNAGIGQDSYQDDYWRVVVIARQTLGH